MAISAYEEKARENKAALQAQMAAYGTAKLEAPAPVVKEKKPAKPRVKKEKAPAGPPPARRSSSRVAGNLMTEEDLKHAREEEQDELDQEWKRARMAKHEDRPVSTDGVKVTGMRMNDEELKEVFKSLVIDAPDAREKKAAKSSNLKQTLKGLELRSIVKVVPDKVYSMVVHPSMEKDLVFIGDKWGVVGLWDATDASYLGTEEDKAATKIRGSEDGEEDTRGKFWTWKAHEHATTSVLKLDPVNSSNLYSSSYDCTLRRMNFETGISSEVISADSFSDNLLIHGFDLMPDGNSIWASDSGGGLMHRDLRESIKSTKRWICDRGSGSRRKISNISLNPVETNYAVTAHLSKDMRLWDLRKITSLAESSTKSADVALTSFAHGHACSSAYFSPSGKTVVTTSYDDCLRIWNFDHMKVGQLPEVWLPAARMAHDCQTGQWVSVFKAQAAASYITVGNMKRGIDVYSHEGDLITHLTSDHLTAVPAITSGHPLRDDRIYGANGSGKVGLWA